MARIRTTSLALLIAISTSCTPRAALERLVLGDLVERAVDLPYGEGERRTLDVYQASRARGTAPVVVFLYGGRWKYGSKDDYLLVANAFVRRGWVTVVPDYRLHPAVLFPAWVEDGAAAVRWTADNIHRFGGDARNIIVVGHSAGAHTAALLALDERYLRNAGVPPGVVRGFVSVAGPVDTNWTAPDVQRLMGPRDGWPETYPATHVDGRNPPLLLMHGGSDDVALPVSSTRLAATIQQRGGCASARIYSNLGHIDIAVALGLPALRAEPVLDDLEQFIEDPAGFACVGGAAE